MDLYSPKDKILLKNCIVIKLKYLELELQKPNVNYSQIENDISYYSNLYEILKVDDIENLIATMRNSIEQGSLVEFNNSILSNPAKDIAEEHIELVKKLFKGTSEYSEEKFEELKKAFYKGNEDLISTKSPVEYEEEPTETHCVNHSTELMQKSLDNLNHLIKHYNPKTMSASDFKSFASNFRDFTYTLGKQKFQQYFDTQEQTIQDMQISYDSSQNEKPVYKTDFTLSNSDSKEIKLTLEESASNSGFTSTYFQNLCYSYLEADKFSKLNETDLDNNSIYNQFNFFKNCYKKLEEMTTKCKITISKNSIFYSSESEIEPTELDLEACNSKPEVSSIENELEI